MAAAWSLGVSKLTAASIVGFFVLIVLAVDRFGVIKFYGSGGGGGSLIELGGFSISSVQLQTRVPGSVEPQSVVNDTASSWTERIANLTLLVRKSGEARRTEAVEEGLARARAAIRMAMMKGEQSATNASIVEVDGVNSSSSFIYRDPRAFFQ